MRATTHLSSSRRWFAHQLAAVSGVTLALASGWFNTSSRQWLPHQLSPVASARPRAQLERPRSRATLLAASKPDWMKISARASAPMRLTSNSRSLRRQTVPPTYPNGGVGLSVETGARTGLRLRLGADRAELEGRPLSSGTAFGRMPMSHCWK